MPVDNAADSGRSPKRLNTEPHAQASDAATSTNAPAVDVGRDRPRRRSGRPARRARRSRRRRRATRCARGRVAVRSRPIDEHHPERNDRDEQRRQSRRDALLGPADGAVAAAEHEHAGDRRVAPLRSASARGAPRARAHAVEQHARHEEASAAHEERRDRLDGVANREVRRSPHDVHRGERGEDARPRILPGAVAARHRRAHPTPAVRASIALDQAAQFLDVVRTRDERRALDRRRQHRRVERARQRTGRIAHRRTRSRRGARRRPEFRRDRRAARRTRTASNDVCVGQAQRELAASRVDRRRVRAP